MTFKKIIEELKFNFNHNRDVLVKLSTKNPNLLYSKINEITEFIGNRYGLKLYLYFPEPKKITEFESYGRENIGMIVDRFKKNFSVSRDVIKSKALAILDGATVSDAYMYEGKEGVRILLPSGRIEILPGSVFLWCKIDDKIERYMDWLLKNVLLN